MALELPKRFTIWKSSAPSMILFILCLPAKIVVTNSIETHHHHAMCFPLALLVHVPASSSPVKTLAKRCDCDCDEQWLPLSLQLSFWSHSTCSMLLRSLLAWLIDWSAGLVMCMVLCLACTVFRFSKCRDHGSFLYLDSKNMNEFLSISTYWNC